MFAYYPLPADGGAGGGALSVYVDPNPAEFYQPYRLGTATVDVVAVVTGGAKPYSYKWTYLSGDTQIYPASFISGDNTFTAHSDGTGIPIVYNAVWRLTVTDALSATASVDVDVRLAIGTSPP
jgi:hypothetical protein